MSDVERIGLVVNPDKPQAFELAGELVDRIHRMGRKAVVESPSPCALDVETADLPKLVKSVRAVFVLGGDGSLLRVAREAAPAGIPIAGVQFGRYGFIMDISPDNALDALDRVISGSYEISLRLMLSMQLLRDGRILEEHYALNDVVVARGPLSRLLRLRVEVGRHEVVRYSADGIIVATPTGSTAYSLSAGGPVVHPSVDVVVITPIAPHTLNSRTLVIPASEDIEIKTVGSELDGNVTVDGQHFQHVGGQDVIRIFKAPFYAKLVQIRKSSFYEQLESRLGFGERFDR